MPDVFKVDYSSYARAVDNLLKMDGVKATHIERVFRNADKPLVQSAKMIAHRSRSGMYSKKYPSRTHKAGHLRSSIRFTKSRKYKLTYYVNPSAWYNLIYQVPGKKRNWDGHPFIKYAWNNTRQKVNYWIRDGLNKLIKEAWNG